ncbi:MAG: S-layer homology domain-containing protein, partial [Gudongella sp.]|nr:S-layer homology domain-containing protein [Gudongella sp.]
NVNDTYSVVSPVISGYTASILTVAGTMPADDVEVTVVYTANDYTLAINYEYVGGAEAATTHTDTTLNVNDTYSVVSPVISGYTASILTVAGTMPADDVEVTVVYTANDQTLVYNANGGVGTMSDRIELTDTEFNLDQNLFTRDGFKFVGWNKLVNGNTVEYVDEALFTMPSSDTTLYAMWAGLTVVKEGVYEDFNEDEKVNEGDRINYTITVTNTGTITLTYIVVEDIMLGINETVASLAPEASEEFTGSHTLAQADLDLGLVTNKVTADAEEIEEPEEDEEITELEKAPGLTVVKEGVYEDFNEDEKVNEGDRINYTITVTNTGTITLTYIVVEDIMLGINETVASLAPEASEEFTGSHTLAQADLDLGLVTNKVTADAEEIEEPEEDEEITELEKAPGLTVVKEGVYEDFNEDEKVNEGDRINYTITVTNTGTITLTNVLVEDTMLEINETIASLAPGASEEFTGSHTLTQADLDLGSVTNRVTADAEEIEEPVEDEVITGLEETLSLDIKKIADRTTFSSTGEVITYTYLVTNNGNVTLSGPFTIVDDKIATINMSVAPEILAPSESFTVTATYAVTSADMTARSVTNVAKATGNFIDETQELVPVTATDSVTVTKKTSGGGGGGGSTETIDEEVPQALPELNREDHFQYIQGYPDNTVRPEGKVTREEVAAVFYRLLATDYRDSIKTLAQDFNDLDMMRWSNKHIATLANGNIVEGYPDGSFKPGNFITRAELATIASRFDNLSPFESNSFSDIEGHWANKYINSASQKGWVNGYPDGSFKPDQEITRAEFVTLVNNVLERRVHKENILENARMFPDLAESKWYYEAMQESINSHLYIRLEDTFEQWEEIIYPSLEM